jgi:hypothetical protein
VRPHSGLSVISLSLIARLHIYGSRRLQYRYDKHLVGHIIRAIGSSTDEVTTPAIRVPLHYRVGYITIDILRGRSVLVDQLFFVEETDW